MNLPKAAIAIIKTGGTYPLGPGSMLQSMCNTDYTVSVGEEGFARKISKARDVADNIEFPPSEISNSDFNFLIKEVKAHFEIFNIEIVTSFSSLWSSNAQKKTIVFLCDQNKFNHSLEYNSLITAIAWQDYSPGYKIPDGSGNGRLRSDGTGGMYLTDPEDPSTQSADIAIAFTNFIEWSERFWIEPSSDEDIESGYQIIQSVENRAVKDIADVVIHELGHAFKLDHFGLEVGGDQVLEYYSGNTIWAPIMGNGGRMKIKQWSNGSYDNSYNVNGSQNDVSIISSQASLLKLKDINIKYEKSEDRSTPSYLENSNQLISRRAKLVSVLDINEIQGVKVIEGMIGFPDDTDLLKIILKAGNYEIGAFQHDFPNNSMLHLGLKILKSKIEVSKQSNELNRTRIPEEEKEETCACSAEFLPEKYPVDSKEECVALSFPESVYISRPDLSQADSRVLFHSTASSLFDSSRIISFSIDKTCLIYLRAYGDKIEKPDSTGFPRYGSLGKYRIAIRKDGNDFDLNNILPQQTPPNCFATEKLSCLINGEQLEKIFFTQDPSDFSKNPEYDGQSDNANIKRFNIVVNGKLIEIPLLLQWKEYDAEDQIQDEEKKQIFFITSASSFESKKQEFVIAPDWDY